ncbi:hypothetical protein HYV50_04645 [Candidatus Pacearchaeota archaeon]|nr:hypothetical protein [Candidatus Pacearchaeota archaeon]
MINPKINPLILAELEQGIKDKQPRKIIYFCNNSEKFFFCFVQEIQDDFVFLQNNFSRRTLCTEISSIKLIEKIEISDFKKNSPKSKSQNLENEKTIWLGQPIGFDDEVKK